MPAGSSLYALPLPTISHRKFKAVKPGKRKRTPGHDDISDTEVPLRDVEYSAVVTPEERAQRRLAGQPLNQSPPPFPFPHAPLADRPSGKRNSPAQTSSIPVRIQHLSNMTALLHKCLANRDYARASRALALILRTEVHGRTIDIRHAGLWGIGAELLFRSTAGPSSNAITREGFEKARVFYDRVSLQYPWHRSWPDAINVQDFKIAFFGLWIYVVDQESRRLQIIANDASEEDRQMTAKEWELTEAENIARELDILMSSLPFVDDVELIRLRAMVALWTADLIETIDDLRNEAIDPELELERAWLGDTELDQAVKSPTGNMKAEVARATAERMFAKLRVDEKDEVGDEE